MNEEGVCERAWGVVGAMCGVVEHSMGWMRGWTCLLTSMRAGGSVR